MDLVEARALLQKQLVGWRARSYAQLAASVGESHRFEIAGAASAYQGEVLVLWDGAPHGDVRVIATIDDGGWRWFAPLTRDFIMRPDGTFVGE